eukprot:9990404-Alexandrium_andersonii.AAC.1
MQRANRAFRGAVVPRTPRHASFPRGMLSVQLQDTAWARTRTPRAANVCFTERARAARGARHAAG